MIRWPWLRRRTVGERKRSLRIVLAIDAKPLIDISDRLALSMIAYRYGAPIEHSFTLPDPLGARHVVKLTLSEVES